MKKWLPLLIALTACTQASIPSPSTDLGIHTRDATAGQINVGMLSKDASLAKTTTLLISHATLGKPFVYMMGIIRSTNPKMDYYESFYPRLVQFSLNGQELVMEDVLPREPFDRPFQAMHKIVAHFPIVSDDGQTIEFDFASGMKALGVWLFFQKTDGFMPSLYSYIASSHTSPTALTLDQHVQATGDAGSNHMWVVRHIFSSSLVKSTLEPRKPDETKQVGYFTIAPWYNAGNSMPHEYITRWSLDHPIRFAVSTNTPAEYREGIIQGILDWNVALGKDVFKLVDTPANLSPLDMNIELGIHWVQNDARTSAYATFLPHPQTGEILHADVIVYSGWGKAYENSYKNPTFQLDGFSSANVCDMDDADMQAEIDATPELQDKDTLLRYVKRAFRALVHHEVGHTLGLRHNFMGTLGAEASEETFDTLFKDFLAGKDPQNTPAPSSSTMDYISFSHAIFMPPVATYDQAAIQWGYFSPIGSIPNHPPLFCNDTATGAGGSADCTLYDAGTEPLVFIRKSLGRDIVTYIKKLLKIADYPQSQLDKTPAAALPSTGMIANWTSKLKRYSSAQVSVLGIGDKQSLERRAMAKTILASFTSPKSWGVPELFTAVSRLNAMARTGSHDDRYWARDVLTRLKLGVQNLNSALDAAPSVNNEGGNGTTTDLDFGD